MTAGGTLFRLLFPAAILLSAGSGSRAQVHTGPPPGPDYSAIDAHALSAPPAAERSFKSLADWLTGPCRSDEEKARALFRWITQNIDYDVEALFSGRAMSGNAGDALRDKRGVCEGYAGLFMELARASGISAVEISGYAKGFGYVAGQSAGPAVNHAWNAVNIGGRWKLLDCTWGAGYVGDDRKFHRSFEPHFFFTPPHEFVLDHLPQKEEWQLLASPVSRREFERTVEVKPALFTLGIIPPRNTAGTIRAEGEVVLRLELTRPVSGLASLSRGGTAAGETYTFVQEESGVLVVRVTPPEAGEYTLRLYAKSPGDTGMYAWILGYRIESLRRPAMLPVYPRKFREFDGGHVRLLMPIRGVLEAGSKQKFRIVIPRASQAAIVVNEHWIMLRPEGEEYSGEARVERGTIAVCARYAGRTEWDTLLEYKGK